MEDYRSHRKEEIRAFFESGLVWDLDLHVGKAEVEHFECD